MEIVTSTETIKLNSILKLILPYSGLGMPGLIIIFENLEKTNKIHF